MKNNYSEFVILHSSLLTFHSLFLMQSILHTTDIRRNYGDLPVLKGINLAIEPGEVVSIVGASGAGKTTLLQILGTLDRPDSGELHIAGQNVFTLNDRQLAQFRNERIGFVFQFNNLLPEFTAIENVCLPGFIAGKDEQAVRQRAEELLTTLGLQHRLTNLPSQLSGGEQQRAAVARCGGGQRRSPQQCRAVGHSQQGIRRQRLQPARVRRH